MTFGKTMRAQLIVLLLAAIIGASCAQKKPVDLDAFVDNAAAIVLLTRDTKGGAHRLTEILKNDGSFSTTLRVGDTVRMMLSEPKADAIISVVGRGFYGSELVPQREYTEMAVVDGAIPSLNGASVDQLRALAKKRPNKAPEPTP